MPAATLTSPRALAAYESQVMREVRSALDDQLSAWLKSGVRLPDADELARLLISSIPDAPVDRTYAELIGPCFSSAGIRRVLGIPSKQALDDRRQRGTILAAQTSDGVWVYPAFQVDAHDGQVHARLRPLLQALKGAPRWGTALWFVTPQPDLGELSPLEASKQSSLRTRTRELAEQYAATVAAA